MEELEFVQRKLLKALIEETAKEEEKQKNIPLVNQLSKTIGENSKDLDESDFAPSLLSRIKSLITIKYDAEKNYNDVDNEEIRRFKILHQNTKSGIYLQLDNQETSRKCNESQRVF
jgi:hypothetical protein